MAHRPDCGTLPWLTAGVGIAGIAARFFLPNPASWSLAHAWPIYLAVILISGFLLLLAYWGWECHRERLVASLPPVPIRQLLHHLAATEGWAGKPAEFNRHASRLLYGASFSELISEQTDYYSALMSGDFVCITSVTDVGNLSNGTPDTMVAIELTEKARKVLATVQSNPQFKTDALERAA